MFEQQRLGDNGTSAARSEECDDRGDEMKEQHDQVAHLGHRTDQHKRDKTWNPLGSMRQIWNSPQTGGIAYLFRIPLDDS